MMMKCAQNKTRCNSLPQNEQRRKQKERYRSLNKQIQDLCPNQPIRGFFIFQEQGIIFILLNIFLPFLSSPFAS